MGNDKSGLLAASFWDGAGRIADKKSCVRGKPNAGPKPPLQSQKRGPGHLSEMIGTALALLSLACLTNPRVRFGRGSDELNV